MDLTRQVYVDIDDVLSDTTIIYPRLLERYFGKKVSFEEITSFDLGKSLGLNQSELAEFMHIVHSPQIISKFAPIDGAIDTLSKFISIGYEIVVVTGRPPSVQKLTEEWLNNYHIPYNCLLFVDKYSRESSNASYPFVKTLKELSDMNFCFAIEDSSDMAKFLSRNMKLPVALFDRPWNRNSQFSNPGSAKLIYRCLDWNDIRNLFGAKGHKDLISLKNRGVFYG